MELRSGSDIADLIGKRAPRYTSYPTAPIFTPNVGQTFQQSCIKAIDADAPLSLYVHIPFCERLCWFCACRTQGTQTLAPVRRYVDILGAELALIRKHLPEGARFAHLHWGGGTPTILPPELINRLADEIKSVIPPTDDAEFSVEIDPTLVDADKIAALRRAGFNRASIGIQDFSPVVQGAIGRNQSYAATKRAIDMIRDAGVHSLNVDLVYGLPHQTQESIAASIEQVNTLDPDRVALFGYAHVPWMAKRQKLIDEAVLPDDVKRRELFQVAADLLQEAGLCAIGIDHFAKPEDALSVCNKNGRLRRNFQGYTDDDCQTLIGLGASSISRFPQGYVQNSSATGAYTGKIEAGELPGFRGHVLTKDDALRGRAIEMLMCDFAIDFEGLRSEIGPDADQLKPLHCAVADRFPNHVSLDAERLTIQPCHRAFTRVIAAMYDAYKAAEATYSQAS
ncbi:MAG: oxygen-independent coproporphyrinogen III oxidase [Hyphomicrobiales bacterium]|nr:oxygen-independent coproporphyrinogen III oxidase [Hyphomicrobiales bacterium]